MAADVTITRDDTHRQFEARLDHHVARLVYRDASDGAIVLLHTEVPEAFQGRGVGGKLARAAFEYARGAGRRVVVLCPFVKTYLERHPEYLDLLADRAKPSAADGIDEAEIESFPASDPPTRTPLLGAMTDKASED